MYHPWRALRALVEWTYDTGALPEGTLGVTDFEARTITLAHGLTQAERRATIAHEVLHVERGPTVDSLEAREERWVEQEAARRLISYEALAHAVLWAHTVEELADELWVDVDTVLCRLRHLHPSERTKLTAALRSRDGHEENE